MRAPPSEASKTASTVHAGERFTAALVAWLDWLRHNRARSARTVDKYAGYLDRLRGWCAAPPEDARLRPSRAGATPLELTTSDLAVFCGPYAHHLGITPRSRRPLVAAVRGFYSWCSAEQLLTSDPAERLVYPGFGRPLPRAISLAEAERMLMAPDIETFLGLRDASMIAVLTGCGVRVSGLVAMNESSLIWGSDDAGEHLLIRVTEKGKKDRVIPVPQEAALLLRAYLGHDELKQIDRDVDGDRVLWVTKNNHRVAAHDYHGERRRITSRTVRQSLDRHGKRAKVPKAHRHPHAFRHLYGTELTEDDVPTLQLQGLMGHANAKDTEIYTHLAMRKLRASVERGNPLAKMKAPLLDSLRSIGAAQRKARVPTSNRRL